VACLHAYQDSSTCSFEQEKSSFPYEAPAEARGRRVFLKFFIQDFSADLRLSASIFLTVYEGRISRRGAGAQSFLKFFIQDFSADLRLSASIFLTVYEGRISRRGAGAQRFLKFFIQYLSASQRLSGSIFSSLSLVQD